MSSLDSNDTFVEIILKEDYTDTDDEYTDLLKAVIERIQLKTSNLGEGVIRVCRGDFTDTFVGPYCIRENKSGVTQGLYKLVDGSLKQITLPLRGEMKLIKGSGVGPPTIPDGWKLITDTQITNKYNIGVSPNWIVAAIEYEGV